MSNVSIEARIEALLREMSLGEKIGQTAMGGTSSRETGQVSEALLASVRAGEVGAFLNVMNPQNLERLQRAAVEESRLGIPLVFARDVVHGFRTIFPIPLALACSWNPAIARKAARVSAIEATAQGIRWTFAPMMDITRDPRWGRIAETFGEDPFLASAFSVAMVEGFQTDDLTRPDSMLACGKHFAGYGAAEGGRDYNTTLIPERELRDVYLEPFRAAVQAGMATLMAAFNEIDGIPASGHRQLLTEILREEWGFDGCVVSDWDAIPEMIVHGFAADAKEAVRRAFLAGLNMEMATDLYRRHLPELIAEGEVSETWLDERVREVLRLKLRMGLFENPGFRSGTTTVATGASLTDEHVRQAYEAAAESVVLLRNAEGLLPLDPHAGQRVAVIGPLADAPREQLGTWTFDGRAEDSITPLAALRSLLGEDSIRYAPGTTHSRSGETDGFAAAVEAAEASDVVLFFGGEEAILSGEAHSLANIDLPGAQNALLERLGETGRPIVLVLMSGRPNTITQLLPRMGAVLAAFHGGTMAGPALADLIFGRRSPSGRLPFTWPVTVGQIPIYYNHKNTGRPADEATFVSMDDIPIGAWQSSLGNESHYLDIGFRPLFPFGYGLTYGEFEYTSLEVRTPELKAGETLRVRATVRNRGRREATEVVQLYVRDLVGDVTRPIRELKGMERVTLAPGEQRAVAFAMPVSALSFHDSAMKEVVEPGEFAVWIAPDATSGLEGRFRVVG